MAIRIKRNDSGNCITFEGSSNPVYWNACLSAEVDPVDSTRVNVVNMIKTANLDNGEKAYEFFKIPYTGFEDKDGNAFANAQEVADYITVNGNVVVGTGVTYKGVWDATTNVPDITTDTSGFNLGDFYKIIASGTYDFGSGDVDFINGDEVIWNGTEWDRKPYAGALIEYDSTSILLNNNAAVYADGAQGLEEPNGAEDGWYFKNDEAGKKINWYFVGNENAGYQMNKATLEGGYVRLKVLTEMGVDSPFFSLYTTPKGDGFDAFWYRSKYSYTGDFTGISANQEVIAYWGDNPTVHPELTRVQLSLNASSTLLSTAPDISTDAIYTMSLGTNSAATVDSLEFIAKELGYKNQQYLRSYLLEAKLENLVVTPNGSDLTDEVVDFKLDDTSTSVMLDNGYAYGVNTIKAIDKGDGLITIKSIQGDLEHFHSLDHTNVTLDGVSISGGLNDVINTLNELFTVGAFQSVVIADPYSTMIADVDGVATTEATALQGTAIETGTDEFGATTSGYNAGGYKTPETINQAGEYFTFDIRNEGIIGFGLVPSATDYANGDYNGNATYANPSTFCNGTNSGHYGYQFSHWFHPSPNGPWTNYGANTSYSMREGWSSSTKAFRYSDEGIKWVNGDVIKMSVGIDENNFIVISYFDESTSLFVPIARTSYPVPNGLDYHLGIKFGDTTVRLVGLPKIHELEELAPTMNFRVVESPDGVYNYPVFATTEEAEYYDDNNGGTGTYNTIVFPDDPTFTTWYIPTNGYTNNGTSIPTTDTFLSNPVTYTEITTLTNADLVPSAFVDNTIYVDELSGVNVQLHPAGASYITSIVDTDSSGLTIDVNGIHLNGTAPEVTGDNVANPSDTYNIEVVRTNSYGSSSGTLTLVVANLTAVITPISGFNHISGTTAMIDSDTMDDGSAVHTNGTVADGERFVIEKAYIEANILPNLTEANDMYVIGLANNPDTLGDGVALSDFDTAIVWEYESATSHTFKFYRDGVVQQNIVINSLTQAFYDYAIEINGTSAWLIACNINNIMNEASPADGGAFSNTYEATNIEDTAPVNIHIAVLNTTGDISTDDIETITTPTPAPSHLTSWDKALDFSGSEYTKQVSNSMIYQPMQMNGLANLVSGHSTQGYTSNASSSRPWATACVFKADRHNSTQVIWNQGEGSSNGDDNISLVLGSNGDLNLQWGRQGTGVNQCRLAQNISSSNWYGVYIAHSGERLGGNDASASNLADCFDIRLMSSADSFNAVGSNLSTSSNWIYTGQRMDRTIAGDFTVGGRESSSYLSYHGKVASMVVHCLKLGVAMPDATEIKLIITDPTKWEADYLIGNTYRRPTYSSNSSNYQKDTSLGFASNQMWLMGDTSTDAFPNIRNNQRPVLYSYTSMDMFSMVSNDIENVNISGLS